MTGGSIHLDPPCTQTNKKAKGSCGYGAQSTGITGVKILFLYR